MIMVETINTSHNNYLYIKVDEGKMRAYKWISGSWEPIDAHTIAETVLSGEACVQGTLVTGKPLQLSCKELIHNRTGFPLED